MSLRAKGWKILHYPVAMGAGFVIAGFACSFDQRDLARPSNGNNAGFAYCDKGTCDGYRHTLGGWSSLGFRAIERAILIRSDDHCPEAFEYPKRSPSRWHMRLD